MQTGQKNIECNACVNSVLPVGMKGLVSFDENIIAQMNLGNSHPLIVTRNARELYFQTVNAQDIVIVFCLCGRQKSCSNFWTLIAGISHSECITVVGLSKL